MLELQLLEELYNQFEKYAEIIMDKIIEYDYYTFFNSVIISGFFVYCRTMTVITNIYQSAYNNFELVRNIDYTVNYSFNYLHSLCFLYTIEPYRLSWYANCWIEKTSIDQYIFHEKIANSKDSNEKKRDYCLIDISNENCSYDLLFIGKIMTSINDEPKYYSRRIDGKERKTDNVDITLFSAIPASIHFLSVTYKHSKMETSIDLQIENAWFMEGNEILSASFIHRELAHQSKSFVFDDNYILEIIDQNINIIEIGYYEYIEIKNDSYKIIDTNKPYDNSIVFVPSMNQYNEHYEEDYDEDYDDNLTTISGSVSYLSSHCDNKDTLYHNNDHKND